MDIFELLKRVTVDCKDDGERFVTTDRLDFIEQMLAGTSYSVVAREPLALLYAKRSLREGDEVVLVSSHVDCAYGHCFCADEGDALRGTFDNSFGNAAVLWCMLNDCLPDNVVVAFTGDEERDSRGAVQALLAFGRAGCKVSFALVQDVTNEGWDSEALFALENDSGIDILTAHKILTALDCYDGRYVVKHDALPDESWDYAEYGIPALALCAPVGGELHSDSGVVLRKTSATEYCNALCKVLDVF